jgi:hypothetical protein
LTYSDRRIDCDDGAIVVRGYYFPLGTKRIPYESIRGAVIVPMPTASAGKWRIWGTANPGLWASFDPQRSRKTEALILDLGKRVKPFLTPDDLGAVAQVIHARTGLNVTRQDRPVVI